LKEKEKPEDSIDRHMEISPFTGEREGCLLLPKPFAKSFNYKEVSFNFCA